MPRMHQERCGQDCIIVDKGFRQKYKSESFLSACPWNFVYEDRNSVVRISVIQFLVVNCLFRVVSLLRFHCLENYVFLRPSRVLKLHQFDLRLLQETWHFLPHQSDLNFYPYINKNLQIYDIINEDDFTVVTYYV